MSDYPTISGQLDHYVASQGFRNTDVLLCVMGICLLFWVGVAALVVEFL